MNQYNRFDFNKYKNYYLPEKRPVSARILSNKPRNANGSGGSKQCVKIRRAFAASCWYRQAKQKASQQNHACEAQNYDLKSSEMKFFLFRYIVVQEIYPADWVDTAGVYKMHAVRHTVK